MAVLCLRCIEGLCFVLPVATADASFLPVVLDVVFDATGGSVAFAAAAACRACSLTDSWVFVFTRGLTSAVTRDKSTASTLLPRRGRGNPASSAELLLLLLSRFCAATSLFSISCHSFFHLLRIPSISARKLVLIASKEVEGGMAMVCSTDGCRCLLAGEGTAAVAAAFCAGFTLLVSFISFF